MNTYEEQKYQKLYHRLKVIARPLARLLFGIKKENEIQLPAEPCLVVGNHACYFDPLIMAMCVDQPLFFVTGENLLRHRLSNFLAVDVFHSISCSKGKMNVKTIREISASLKAGHSVNMFAEGNITYDGATAPLAPVNGKFFRALKCTVVTITLTGAYQIIPRWSGKFCRGNIHAKIAGIYTKEMLRSMTPEEILDCFNRDLYVEQPDANTGTVCHRSAKGIHHVLYTCPECGSFGKIRGKGKQIRCLSCKKTWKYNEYGKIEGGSFETIWQWNRWQERFVKDAVRSNRATQITAPHARLYQILDNHKRQLCESGQLTLDGQKLSCGSAAFPLDDISRMDTRNKGVILFSLRNENYYEIRIRKDVSGLMYKTFFEALKES